MASIYEIISQHSYLGIYDMLSTHVLAVLVFPKIEEFFLLLDKILISKYELYDQVPQVHLSPEPTLLLILAGNT